MVEIETRRQWVAVVIWRENVIAFLATLWAGQLLVGKWARREVRRVESTRLDMDFDAARREFE